MYNMYQSSVVKLGQKMDNIFLDANNFRAVQKPTCSNIGNFTHKFDDVVIFRALQLTK